MSAPARLSAAFVAAATFAAAAPARADDRFVGTPSPSAPPRVPPPVVALGTPVGLGLSAGVTGVMLFRADPQGTAFVLQSGFGAQLGYDLGQHLVPALGLPERLACEVGLGYSHAAYGEGVGSEAVRVTTTLDTLALPVRLGLRFGDDERTVRLTPWLGAGPGLQLVSVEYTVDDPVGRAAGRPPQQVSASGQELALATVAGGTLELVPEDGSMGLLLRAELARVTRSGTADWGLGLSLGAAF